MSSKTARPSSSHAMTSPSIMQDCTGSAAAAKRMEGNPIREVSAVAGYQPYTERVPVRHEAKAVVLYLMNPLWSAGRPLGRTRQAGLKSGLGLIGADPAL